MTKRRDTKKTLVSSVIALMLSFVMLIGTTFAWFTDSVTSANNKIVAGNLDVQLLMHDGTDYKDISNTESSIFGGENSVIAQNKNTDTLWEPGKTQVAYLAIKNNGNLALQYTVALEVRNPEDGKDLYKAMEYVISPDKKNGEVASWAEVKGANGENVKTADLGTQIVSNGVGRLLKNETHYFALSVHMMEEAGNEYQNGKIDFDLSVIATQLSAEEDSFGPTYDEHAEWPVWLGETNNVWEGTGTETDPYILDSAADLAGFAQMVNGTTRTRAAADSYAGKYFKLTTDVDLNGMSWEPIGRSGAAFSGHFDGDGHTISNLYVAGGRASDMGFFGFTTGGSVKNLKFHNADVSGRLNVGVVAGTPYTSTYDNITITGEVKVNGMSYVGGAFGKNGYANLTNITIDVEEGSYVKANSVEKGVAYRTYVGGLIGFMGEGGHKVENVTSNIDVIGSTCDIGGIAGIAHYGNSFTNCSSSGDVTLTNPTEMSDTQEIGGIAGVWNNGGANVTFTNCKYTGTLSATGASVFPYNGLVGKPYSTTGAGKLIIDGVDMTADYKYIVAKDNDALENALKSDAEYILVELGKDLELNGNGVNFGGANTKGIVINGNGNKLTLTTTYMISLGTVNPDATLYLQNMTVTTNKASGTWDIYDIQFECDVEVNDVTFEKAVAIVGNSKAVLNNVKFNETHDYYALWIVAGCDVEVNNCTITSAGRGIKIADEYVDSPTLTKLSVSDTKFVTQSKAAILVTSTAGAKITLSNIDISEVEKDTVNAVWVDEDRATYAGLVQVSGGSVIVEP